jgi:hypothetical protein
MARVIIRLLQVVIALIAAGTVAVLKWSHSLGGRPK